MSHMYQPAMLPVLLANGGRASIRDNAAIFLAYDESQIEYSEQIMKGIPGRVLRSHGLWHATPMRLRSPQITPISQTKSACLRHVLECKSNPVASLSPPWACFSRPTTG
jgi:hypothetical protein